jgi:hypothetical protein
MFVHIQARLSVVLLIDAWNEVERSFDKLVEAFDELQFDRIFVG